MVYIEPLSFNDGGPWLQKFPPFFTLGVFFLSLVKRPRDQIVYSLPRRGLPRRGRIKVNHRWRVLDSSKILGIERVDILYIRGRALRCRVLNCSDVLGAGRGGLSCAGARGHAKKCHAKMEHSGQSAFTNLMVST